MTLDGIAWYWVNYSGVLEDIPIAGGSEKTISRRFLKLEAAGVLEHITIREGGTFSCYRLNEKVYTSLVSDTPESLEKAWTDLSDPKTELSEGIHGKVDISKDKSVQGETFLYDGGTELGDGVRQNCPTPSDKSVRPKDSLTRITLLPEELKEPPISPAGGTDTEKAPRSRFVKPTIDELTAYCLQRSNGINAQEFLDHYEANGWKVGKSPMKDWKAAVRTWEHTRAKNLKKADRYHSETTQAAPITGWKKLGGVM